MMCRLPSAAAIFCLVAFLSQATIARGEDPEDLPTRTIGISLSTDRLQTSLSYKDIFTKKIRKKLDSGLPTRIVVQANLERHNKKKPITYWVRSADIVYDLWEEVYFVTVEDERGKRRARAKTADEACNLAGVLTKSTLARVSGLPEGTYRLRFSIEINPVSEEMVENIRRWLSKPSAGADSATNQTNFVGSFVGIFVDRRIGNADRAVAFVSQWFKLGG